MADGMTVTIDGTEHALDDFELGDLEWLEEYLGRPLSDGAALNTMKAAVGLVYLVKRREDDSFTIEDARKVKMSALGEPESEMDSEPDAQKRPTKRAAR